MLQLQWRKCAGDVWCPFHTVVLPDANAEGIVVIWSADPTVLVLYIGAGGIAKILKWARQFEPIALRENLFVTWAFVPEDRQRGVRNYLAQIFGPVYADRAPPDPSILVNLPWASNSPAEP